MAERLLVGAEATENDLRAAEYALYHAMHMARAALHAMENVELPVMAGVDRRGNVICSVFDLLVTIMRDTEAAGNKLVDLCIRPPS